MKPSLLLITLALSAASCASPQARRSWTTHEKVVAVVGGVATGLNYWQTEKNLDNPNCIELNPLYGKRPSDTRLALSFLASELLILWIAHRYPVVDIPLIGECNVRLGVLMGKAGLNTACWLHDREVGRE